MDVQQLIEHIRREMALQGFSQQVLAASAGLSRVTLYRLLSGKTNNPRRRTAYQVARVLGIAPDRVRETLTGQYEMLPILERLPEDDDLFYKALRRQMEAVPEALRLQAVRAALVAMAGVMHQTEEEKVVTGAHRVLQDLDIARWRARKQYDKAS